MRLNDPSGAPYFVNTSTLQVQVDPPTSGEIVHIAEPRATPRARDEPEGEACTQEEEEIRIKIKPRAQSQM